MCKYLTNNAQENIRTRLVSNSEIYTLLSSKLKNYTE